MPNLNEYFQVFLNPTLTCEDRQSLIPELSKLLFSQALTLLQQSGVIRCTIINNNLQYADLSEPSELFLEEDYSGLELANLASCGSFTIQNPYSNPLYFGTDLVQNLWPATVDNLQLLPVPIIKNVAYHEIMKAYCQAELYRIASDAANDHVDLFTPQHFKFVRRVLLGCEALKLYSQLARDVSELFVLEDREKIRIRIYYDTVLPNIIKVTDALINLMHHLAQYAPYETCLLRQYQTLLNDVATNVSGCTATIQSHVNNLASVSQQEIDKCFMNVVHIQTSVWCAKQQLDRYAGCSSAIVAYPKLEFPSLTPLGATGKSWSTLIQIYEFARSLYAAINDANIRKKILDQLNKTNMTFINHNEHNEEILNDVQLVGIYQYLLKCFQNRSDFSISLRSLVPEKDASGMDASIYLVNCKASDGKLIDPDLKRTVSISRSENEFTLSLVPNRKSSESRKTLLKFRGSTASVTAQFDITPAHADKLNVRQASKSIDLLRVDKQEMLEKELQHLRLTIDIARKMGHKIGVGPTYLHTIKVLEPPGYENRFAIRLSEAWAIGTLSDVINCVAKNRFDFLLNDKAFQHATENLNHEGIAAAKRVVFFRLIEDLLNDLVKLHDELKVVHNDVKPDNVLVYLDETGAMRARLTDFGLSLYMCDIQTTACQPVASVNYASPEVVGFMYITDDLEYQQLYYSLIQKNSVGKYMHAAFGRELLAVILKDNKDLGRYKDLKPDHKDDMFSLGVTLYMLLTGHYPTNYGYGYAFGKYRYLSVEKACKDLPTFSALFQGLFAANRDRRLSAGDALSLFQRSVYSLENIHEHSTTQRLLL